MSLHFPSKDSYDTKRSLQNPFSFGHQFLNTKIAEHLSLLGVLVYIAVENKSASCLQSTHSIKEVASKSRIGVNASTLGFLPIWIAHPSIRRDDRRMAHAAAPTHLILYEPSNFNLIFPGLGRTGTGTPSRHLSTRRTITIAVAIRYSLGCSYKAVISLDTAQLVYVSKVSTHVMVLSVIQNYCSIGSLC